MVFLSGKAEFPTRLFGSALFLAFFESWDAFGVLLAFSPLFRAFFFDTFLRVTHSNESSGHLIEAIVVEDTLPEIAGRSISLLSDAVGPASLIVVAFVFTVLEGSQASGVLRAGLGLIGAVVSDAILRRNESNSLLDFIDDGNLNGIHAIVVNNALDILGSVVILGTGKAVFPAVGALVASFVTELKSSDAFSVVRAGLFLSLAVFLNTFLRSV